MSLRLIIGGSGAGKTEFLYKKIIKQSMNEPEQRFFILVPEQATMQAQKEIVRLHPRHGTMNIDIVSFDRLAYRIFSELSLPQPEVLDDTGKTMILRKLAGEKRSELVLFSGQLNRPGFIDEMKSMLSELYQYGATPDMLKEQAKKEGVSRVLAAKLSDMEVVFRAFREFTKERYITMEELLDVLCRVAGRSKLLKGCTLALDGYTGFTPVQYRLIEILLKLCRRMYVTVTATEASMVYGSGDQTDLFDMSRTMTAKLRELAIRQGVEITEDIAFPERPLVRFRKSPALDALEQTFFRYPYRPFSGGTDSLSLIQAETPAAEVGIVANCILQLVKKEGCRYREIALVCGDLPGYGKEIARQFEENGIPLFLDQKRDVSENPFIRLVTCIPELLWKGFDYETMLRYLRTGLVTEEREWIDRLDLYVRALGIRGFSRWSEPWERTFEGGGRLNLKELNEFKESVLLPLRVLKEKAGERGATVGTITMAITELLETLEVEKKLKERSLAFTRAGMDWEAREYGEIYGLVMDLFSRLFHLLGEEPVSKREYLEILKAGLSELSVGMIPASADRVVAGDLRRTRLDHIRALFFLGVNEGVVPGDSHKNGLLTEQERELLKEHEMELAPTAREEGFMERFYLYLMMTKPSEKLCLSWASLSADGKTMRPSSLIMTMKKRFPDIPVLNGEACVDREINRCAAKKAVIRWLEEPEMLMREVGSEHDKNGEENASSRTGAAPGDLYRWLSNEGGQREAMEQLAKACTYSYQDQGIGREAARELYGMVLNGSVTRMEGYASCAYAHFLNHGLELKKRQEYELDLSDMGNLFHRTIDLFFQEVRSSGGDFTSIGETERKRLVRACVEQVAGEYRNTIMKSSARNAYLEKKVERIADRTIRALIYQLKKGDFVPEAFEVDVSSRIPLRGGHALNLRGRIDRMDVLEEKDKIYVKIMDYKSGSTSFDLSLLYHGLQLQLVVYMDAALAMEQRRHPGKEAVPAGIFYYHIDDPVLERKEEMTDEEIEAGIQKKLRMNGLVNSSLEVIRHMDRKIEKESDVIPVAMKDGLIQEAKSSVAGGERFSHLTAFVRRRLEQMGEEILDGTVSVSPYKQGSRTACDYCPYHSVCGFELKTDGFGFRRFRPMTAEEIWKEIEAKEDEPEEAAEKENKKEAEKENEKAKEKGTEEETEKAKEKETEKAEEKTGMKEKGRTGGKKKPGMTEGGEADGGHDMDEGTAGGH